MKVSATKTNIKYNLPTIQGDPTRNTFKVFGGFKNSEPVWTPFEDIYINSINFNGNINIESTGSIGIGNFTTPLPSDSIILNASSTPLSPTGPGLYIAPIQSNTGPNFLYYNDTTKEVTYNPVGITTTVVIVDNLSVTHTMTFENGLLVNYTTSP
jgi:hypothetical protein